MTKEQLYQALEYVDHSREKRKEMAVLISENPNLIAPLLAIAFDFKNPISSKACWVMEFAAKENQSYIFPYLDLFTANIGKVQFDSSIRPMAKICEYLIKSYFHKSSHNSKSLLTDEHLEKIATACFDWLIGEHKVAAKAYSMTCLLLLGRKYDWIRPELKMVIEQNYAYESAAYKARARLTLAELK